jgi:hypothetical protein
MSPGLPRALPDQVLSAGEAALDLFFETWRITAPEADAVRSRRLRLGALRVVQRVTAIGLDETRAGARTRLREARVELRRLGQAGRGAEGQRGSVMRWEELATSLWTELSRLSRALCSQESWLAAESPRPSTLDPRPSTFDPRPQSHDSRLATHDIRLPD